MAQHAPDDVVALDLHIADLPCAQRHQRHEGRDRFKAHGLADAGIEVGQAVHQLDGELGGVGREASHLSLQALQRVRVELEQVDHPRQRVRGGVFTRQEHGQHISHHLAVAQAAVGLVRGDDHGLQQIARCLICLQRLILQAQSGLRHKLLQLGFDHRHAGLQLAVNLAFVVAPNRYRSEGTLEDIGQQFVQVALDHVITGLQGVDVFAKGQA